MTIRKKTGETIAVAGTYVFERYVDPPHQTPAPTSNERQLPLDRGDRVPPVKSCNRAAWYKLH